MTSSTIQSATSEYPIGCRVLHKIDGCEGLVTAHKEPTKYGGPIVVRWEGEDDMPACRWTDAARAEFSSYRAAELLRLS